MGSRKMKLVISPFLMVGALLGCTRWGTPKFKVQWDLCLQDLRLLMSSTKEHEVIRKGGSENAEQWKSVRVANKGDAFDVPEGWELVDINESNFGEYMPKIGHLIDPTMAQGMENGTIKFIRKL